MGATVEWSRSLRGLMESVFSSGRAPPPEPTPTKPAERGKALFDAEDSTAKNKKKAKAGGVLQWYRSRREAKPWVYGLLEGAAFAAAGELVATCIIKQQSADPMRLLFFAGWGAVVAFCVAPWLKLLSSLTLSRPYRLLDQMGKAVLNQLTMTPLLTLVFVAAWEVMLKKTPVPELATRGVGPISEPFTDRYKRTAVFWLTADFVNLLLVPNNYRFLVALAMGAIWAVLSSHMTT